MELPINTLLQGGKYRIIRFIRSGGFGCTYEAEQIMLKKRVAIKEFFVKDFCNRDETTAHITVGTKSKVAFVEKLKKKFIDEAVALSQLDHSGIVRVSDVFEENGTAYFVMDYIDGQSLNDIIEKEEKLSEERALKYIYQVCEALTYVHRQKRLHLDIKPGNIMINNKDCAILIDFGASKQYDEENGENKSTIVGRTPGYAPLEQMGSYVIEFLPAIDIYSLGATLYKLLTGKTPIAANMLAGGETLAPLPSTISPNTVKAIFAAMKVNRRERPQNVKDFLNILGYSKDETELTSPDEITIIAVESSEPIEPIIATPARKENTPRTNTPTRERRPEPAPSLSRKDTVLKSKKDTIRKGNGSDIDSTGMLQLLLFFIILPIIIAFIIANATCSSNKYKVGESADTTIVDSVAVDSVDWDDEIINNSIQEVVDSVKD